MLYILSVAVQYTILDIVMLSVVTSPTVLAFASLVSATTSLYYEKYYDASKGISK
jgi:hypothetical protein